MFSLYPRHGSSITLTEVRTPLDPLLRLLVCSKCFGASFQGGSAFKIDILVLVLVLTPQSSSRYFACHLS